MFQSVHHNNSKYPILIRELNTNQTTFKGKLQESVQSWFRLTPGFSPYLVQDTMDYMKLSKKDLLLDPFSGSGTTIIKSKLERINSIGVEINPVFYEIAKTSTTWNFNKNSLSKSVSSYLNNLNEEIKRNREKTIEDLTKKEEIKIPSIYNVFRWWRKDVLKDLLIAKKLLNNYKYTKTHQFLRLGLMSILLDVANTARLHPTLSFVDRSKDTINVYPILENKLELMVRDIEKVRDVKNLGSVELINGDSTKLSSYIKGKKISAVITSPPYPNRISYVWETRPHLYFFDIFSTPGEAGNLDCETIGGTWGKATSILDKKEIEPYQEFENTVGSIANQIREKNDDAGSAYILANYVTKYFNKMFDHFLELKKISRNDSKFAYIVGNSRIKDVEVYTDLLLAQLFEAAGFRIEKIVQIRKRLGRKNLYESIVYASN